MQPRINWAEASQLIHQAFTRTSAIPKAELLSTSKDVVLRELALCNPNRGYTPDLGVFQETQARNPSWKEILANLYWRAARQAAVWDVYQLLLRGRFVNEECLRIPIDILHPTPDTGLVTYLLDCFFLVYSDFKKIVKDEIPLQSIDWISDIEW